MANRMEFLDNEDGTCSLSMEFEGHDPIVTIFEMDFKTLFAMMIGAAQQMEGTEIYEEMNVSAVVIPENIEQMEGK